MGKTLLEYWKYQAGEFTEEVVLRWKHNSDINADIIYFFSEPSLCKVERENALANQISKTYGVAKKEIAAFIRLISRFKYDEGAEIDPSQTRFLDPTQPTYKGRVGLYRLVYAYQRNLLNAEECKCVENITKVCCSPSEIPGKMQHFAETTLQKLKQCDLENRDELIRILAEAFYQLTEIHPFGNANGRVATYVTNLFLRAFGLPSILFRHPGEKTDPNSLYSKAINEIDHSRELLIQLMHLRIRSEREHPFQSDVDKDYMQTRITIIDIQKKFAKTYPKLDINGVSAELMESAEVKTLLKKNLNEKQLNHQFLKLLLKTLEARIKKLTVATKPAFSQGAVVSPAVREELRSNLARLTNIEQWSTSLKTGVNAWMETKEEREAQRVFNELIKIGITEVTQGKKLGTDDVFCVIIKNIDCQKLSQLAKNASLTPNEVDHVAASALF